MLKVIQFIHGFEMGGAETLVKDYALELDKNKIDLTILCCKRCQTPYEEMLKCANINVIYICDEMPLFGRKEIWARIINRITLYLKIKKYIHKIDADIIHEHLILNSCLKFARPKKGTVIFYTQHFQVKRWIDDNSKDIKALKWLMQHYKVYTIALNHYMRKEMNKIFHNEGTIIINNGINMERFHKALPSERIRENLSIPREAFVVGHVGRFTEIKNHQFLIEVFNEIVKKKSNAFLLMVGEGNTIEEVCRRAEILGIDKKILILSCRTDVPDLMKAMDILVFPSYSEGMPVTLVEAQVSGLKCLVSDVVSKEIKLSNLIKYKSLRESAESWADEAISWKNDDIEYYGIEQWDIKKVIKHLEDMYFEAVTLYN